MKRTGLFFLILPIVFAFASASGEDKNDRFIAPLGTDAYQFSPAHPGDLGSVRLFAIFNHPDAAHEGVWGRVFWQLEIRPEGEARESTLVVDGACDLDGMGMAMAEYRWDGSDQAGKRVGPGRYTYTFRARFVPSRDVAVNTTRFYEELDTLPTMEEAESYEETVVVNDDLTPEQARAFRVSRLFAACQVQQNASLESGFGYNFYYGGNHNHSSYSDGGLDVGSCASGHEGQGAGPAEVYAYARNTGGLDFLAITDHNHLFDDAISHMSPPVTGDKVRANYAAGFAAAQAATVDGSFVALWGQEFGVTTNSDQGHVIVLESPALFGWEPCGSSYYGATPECTMPNCYFDVYVPKRYAYLTLYQRSVENPSPAGALGLLAHPGSSEFDNYAYNANADEAMQGISVRSGLAFSTATTCSDANVASTNYFSRFTKALNIGFHIGPTAEQDAHCMNLGVAVPTRTVYLVPSHLTPALTRANIMAAHKSRHFFATEDSNLQLVFRTGDSTHIMGDIFTNPGSLTLHAAVYDPDGESVSTLEFWRGQIGAGQLTSAYRTVSGQSTFSITEDLTSGTYYYFVHVVQADGHDAWSAPMWVTYTAPLNAANYDFNADGTSDILWRNDTSGMMSVWYANGTGIIGGGFISGISDLVWQVAGVGDFNADRVTDILWRRTDDGTLSVWMVKGDGTGISGDMSPGTVDPSWQIVGVGDADGDRKADIFWRNDASGIMSVWFMNETGIKGSGFIGGIGDTDWRVLGVADFDGDRKCDIFWRNQVSGAMSVWFVTESGYKGNAFIGGIDDLTWQVAGIGDFDGDRKNDIFWRNGSSGDMSIWFVDGNGYVDAVSPGSVGLDWETQNHLNLGH